MREDLSLLVTLVGGAAAIPYLARRVMVPSAIIEIFFGMMVFSFIFMEPPDWFFFLKEVGLIYLMFIAGMELDLKALGQSGRLYMYAAIVLISFLALPALFVSMGMPFFLGIVVSVMSAGVVIPVLKETSLIKTPFGRDTIGFTLSGEFISIMAIAAIDIYYRHGFELGTLVQVLKIALLFSAAFLFLKLLYVAAWWFPEKVEKVMESEDPVEEGIRFLMFIALAGAMLALWVGVDPILGAFLGGMIFSHVFKSKGKFEEKVNALGFGFFVPMFFIGVGASFNVALLHSATGLSTALLLSVMVLASNTPVMLFPLFMRTRFSEACAMTLLLSSPLSMMIVAATIGEKAGLLSGAYFDSVVLSSIISTLLFPLLFRPFARKIAEQGDRAKT